MKRNTFEASGIGSKSFVRLLEIFKISKKIEMATSLRKWPLLLLSLNSQASGRFRSPLVRSARSGKTVKVRSDISKNLINIFDVAKNGKFSL